MLKLHRFYRLGTMKYHFNTNSIIVGLSICLVLQSFLHYRALSFKDAFHSTIVIAHQRINRTITFERRVICNIKQGEPCYSTNKSLVVSFWQGQSVNKWTAQNILTAFPLHSFDHIIFIHDNSSWHSHPGYQHFMWIHIVGQNRLWYLKRFLSPMIAESYKFIWIIDDDAQLDFNTLHYECVVKNLSIALSAPARLTGAWSHIMTRRDDNFSNKIGRWTDFVETGPLVIFSSSVWQCIYALIDATTGTGWGIDLVWCHMLAEHCSLSKSEPKKVCAILDAFGVHHQAGAIQSSSEGGLETPIYMSAHQKWITSQQNIAPLAEDNQLFQRCSQ